MKKVCLYYVFFCGELIAYCLALVTFTALLPCTLKLSLFMQKIIPYSSPIIDYINILLRTAALDCILYLKLRNRKHNLHVFL